MRTWTDPRERNYSANTIDELVFLVVEDPRGIIEQIFDHNALPKWRRHREWFDEFRQELALNLIDKRLHRQCSGSTELLLQWFNGDDDRSFSRWLVTYTRNQMRSKDSPFADLHSERAFSIDNPIGSADFTDIHRDLVSHDVEFDFEYARHLRATDIEVLMFLLDAKRLRQRKRWRDHKGQIFLSRKLRTGEIAIYKRFLRTIAEAGERITMTAFATQIGEDPKEVSRIIPLVGKCLKRRVQELQAHLC